MTWGRLAYLCYYRPIARWKRIRRTGVFSAVLTERNRRQMQRASATLHEIRRAGKTTHQVYFLTGKKYWYQTAFCLYSLQKSLPDSQLDAIFIDDGSFDEQLRATVHRQFPGSTIRSKAETEARLMDALPPGKYPVIHRKRKSYPHLRKLTDIHAGSSGWKMVLDSDMLFFREPVALAAWLTRPELPFFLFDPVCSYYYSAGLMDSLAGAPVQQNLNVGAIGLESDSIDWERLEYWISELENREGDHYFLEQALSAMLAAGQQVQVADPKNYIVMPDREQAVSSAGILHHYVAGSKQWYYRYTWKTLL
jgi:hypothetical protein